jgi:hypothetical protein
MHRHTDGVVVVRLRQPRTHRSDHGPGHTGCHGRFPGGAFVLYEHPDIVEAAVVGVPHESLGEEVSAAVVLTPDTQVTVEDLRVYVKERVAPYKYPRTVWSLPALPKGPTGKILKREIRPPR